MTVAEQSITSIPLKWHGGKNYLATRVVALMPRHTHYVEPFAGGLSVLLAKDPEGVSEVVNDLNFELSIFWRVMASEVYFPEFVRLMQATPFSEEAWREAGEPPALGPDELSVSPVVTAAKLFIRCRQSLAGRMKSFAPLSRTRTRRNMNEQASAWINAVDGLPAVHARLRRVVILNRDALDVIRQQDGEKTLHYCDPPYCPETRTAPDVYAHEMTVAQHGELLATIKACKGKVMLSGYASELYDRELAEWTRHEFSLPNNAAGGETKRRMTEVLYCNF